jgi:hypothetical protein
MIRRNIRPSNMQKSVRASCIVAQNPDFGSIRGLVVAMATRMSAARFHLTSKRERSSHRVPVFVFCVCAKIHEAQVACFFLH